MLRCCIEWNQLGYHNCSNIPVVAVAYFFLIKLIKEGFRREIEVFVMMFTHVFGLVWKFTHAWGGGAQAALWGGSSPQMRFSVTEVFFFFFGAQSLFGGTFLALGTTSVVWGAWPPNTPRGAGLVSYEWSQEGEVLQVDCLCNIVVQGQAKLTVTIFALFYCFKCFYQRWSPRGRFWSWGRPRGHILTFLALASNVKSLALASKPHVLENCPVLGLRTALFFEQLKFRCKTPETSRKICKHIFYFPHMEHRRSQGAAGGLAPQLKF